MKNLKSSTCSWSRTAKELAYMDTLNNLNKDDIYSEVTKGNFIYFNTVTRDEWPRKGRITTWINEKIMDRSSN